MYAKKTVFVLVLFALAVTVNAQTNVGHEADLSPWFLTPEFVIATMANIAGTGLFLSRVHAPNLAPGFGYTTQALGVPALAAGIMDVVNQDITATTWGLFAYAAWGIGSAVIDHVFQVEYRDPRRLEFLIPYVVTYYIGIGVLSAAQLENGYPPWIVAGTTCIAAVAASLYARAKGAD